MDMKDVGFFQKHVEKLVLGGAGLFLVVVGLWVLLGNPYAVEVAGDTISPRELEQRIRDRAQQLRRNLDANDDLEQTIAGRRIPAYAADFRDRVEAPPIRIAALAVGLNLPGLGGFGELPDPDPYFVPEPPVPGRITARSGYGVLGTVENNRQATQLAAFIRDEQTRDIRYVSVGATFDMAAWTARLQQSAPQGHQALPAGWLRRVTQLAGVYLEREEYDPASQMWTNRTIIDPLPNQVAYLPHQTRAWSDAQADAIMRNIQQRQEQIARPEFVPLGANGLWLPPTEDMRELTVADHEQLRDINREIERLNDVIESIEEQVRRQRDAEERRADAQGRRDEPEPAPRGGQVFLLDEPNRPGGQAPRRAPAQDPMQRRLDDVRAQLDQFQEERNELLGLDEDMLAASEPEPVVAPAPGRTRRDQSEEEALEAYRRQAAQWQMELETGAPPRDGAGRGDRRAEPQVRAQPEPEPEPESQDVRVWAHDLSVEPGKTYRYRVVVAMFNPLFRETRLAASQFEQYHNRVGLTPSDEELASADWSDPIRIDPDHQFFLVDGSVPEQRAEVEVWRLYGGAWHRREFEIEPGDVIGGHATVDVPGRGQVELDMGMEAMLVDIAAAGEGPGGVGRRTTRVYYLDPDVGEVLTRIIEEDRDSPHRMRLDNEAALRRQLSRAAAAR
ncbi:MAG: hypothetical protein WD009_05140 [Phycisphaeraceae bacterium]